MADTTYGYTPGAGGTAAVDRITGTDYPYYKLKWGAPGTVNDATAANPFPVTIISGAVTATVTSTTITGTVAVTQSGAWNVGTLTSITNPVAVTQSGTWNIGTITTLPALPAGTNNIGDVDVLTMPAITGAVTLSGSSNAVNATLNAETTKVIGTVNQGGAWSVSVTGTPAVTATLAAETTKQIGVTRSADGAGNLLTSAARGAERALSTQIVDAAGNQITTFGGSGGTASNVNSAIPTVATATGFSDGTNMQLARLFDVDSGAGTQYVLGLVERVIASGGSIAKSFGAGAADAGTQRFTLDTGQIVALGQAVMASSQPTVIASDQTGWPLYAPTANYVSGATAAMTGTTTTSLIAAPAAGLRNYITQITVSNAHATAGTDILIQDGSGGTTLYVIPAAAAFGGAVVTFPTPLRQPTTATALFCANTIAANTRVSASGFKAA